MTIKLNQENSLSWVYRLSFNDDHHDQGLTTVNDSCMGANK